MFIELKTTRYAEALPSYISDNEVEASNDLGAAYRRRRLFRCGKGDAGFYAQLKPDVYRGPSAVDSAG